MGRSYNEPDYDDRVYSLRDANEHARAAEDLLSEVMRIMVARSASEMRSDAPVIVAVAQVHATLAAAITKIVAVENI